MQTSDNEVIMNIMNNFIHKLPFEVDNPVIGTSEWHAREDCIQATANITAAMHACVNMMQRGTTVKDIMRVLTAMKRLYDLP